ncbi:MAG: hypothetical protein PHO37_11635 [Kiritimatiellae bacterium]|nr:hypothetical protein [Kiritimatiellia bacterium]
MDVILEGHCRPIVSDGILAEYADVLSRPKFNLAPERVNYIMDAFRSIGIPASFATSKYRTQVPDEDDVLL